MLTVMPPILTPYQSAVLTVVPDPPQSTLTGRVGRYAGPAYLPFNPLLTHFQPAVLTYMPDHPHSLPISRADRYVGPYLHHSSRPC